MRQFTLFATILALSGCMEKPIEQMNYEERQALATNIIQRCAALGIAPNSPEMTACTNVELEAEMANRAANRQRRQALGRAMVGAGQDMQANARRSVNCTSTAYGDTVSTNCY